MPPKTTEAAARAKEKAQAKAAVEAALAKAEAEAQAKTADGAWVIVSTTHGQSRRRAGFGFSPEETRINVKDLTKDQQLAIMSDPVLKAELDVGS